jgi:hypothetical protein
MHLILNQFRFDFLLNLVGWCLSLQVLSSTTLFMRPAPFTLRAIAALLWLAHLVAGTQVLPAALTVLAEFDAEHHLVLAHTAAGYELILAHAEGTPTPAPCQHRHELGRLLASLTALDGHGNHSCRLAFFEPAFGSDREQKIGEAISLQTLFVAVEPLPWTLGEDECCTLERRIVLWSERPLAAMPCWGWASVQMQV